MPPRSCRRETIIPRYKDAVTILIVLHGRILFVFDSVFFFFFTAGNVSVFFFYKFAFNAKFIMNTAFKCPRYGLADE